MGSDIRIVSAGTRDIVGESPVYDPDGKRLVWVDIIGRKIRCLEPATGSVTSHPVADFPTAIGLTSEPDHAVAAFAGGVALVDLESGSVAHFASIDGEPDGNRLNEGAVGPDGAFWVGTMQTNLNRDGSMRDMTRSSGAFYRVGRDRSVRRVTTRDFGISNTLAWDEARGRMYLGDTLTQTLYRLPWPLPDTGLPPRQVHAQITTDGYPDGSCIDSEGYIWNARYDGGCLLRISPEGKIDRRIQLPARHATACCFGGPEHRTLYVTTAANELSEAELRDPHQGAVLALEPGVTGRPAHRFRL